MGERKIHERVDFGSSRHHRRLHRLSFWWLERVAHHAGDADGVDYFTGLIVAALFHASPKTPDGRLESFAGWKGLCRKGVSLAIVWVAKRLDLTVGSDFIGDAVIIAYIANEAISIIENAGRMGVPIPEVVVNAIEVLKKDKDKEQGK